MLRRFLDRRASADVLGNIEELPWLEPAGKLAQPGWRRRASGTTMAIHHLILSALSNQPQSGATLAQKLRGLPDATAGASSSRTYKLLASLSRSGLIEAVQGSAGQRGGRIWRLTQQGRADLDAWLLLPGQAAAPMGPIAELLVVAACLPGRDPRVAARCRRELATLSRPRADDGSAGSFAETLVAREAALAAAEVAILERWLKV